MRYGIPDFKMEKHLIDRRVEQMKKEGVLFKTSIDIENDISVSELKKDYHAVLICSGSEHARDLNIPGREASGVHFANGFFANAK